MVAGYKINKKKSVAFLYTNNEISEKVKKTKTKQNKRKTHLKSHQKGKKKTPKPT